MTATEYWTVEEVAAALKLHVRTVRRYLREGRLKGTRVGKQYRIARGDLEAFTGSLANEPGPVRRTRHVEVASIVQIDAISPEEGSRLANFLLAAAKGRDKTDARLLIDTRYDEERGSLKIIINGSVPTTAALLGLIDFSMGNA